MSFSTTQTTLNHHQLTNQILNSNSLHLILLFLPFTISTTAAIQTFISSSQNLVTLKTLITILTTTCFTIIPTITGIILTTCSTNKAIHHNPLTVSSTLKSLSHSDTHLLHTVIIQSIKLITLLLATTFFLILFTEAIKAALSYHFGFFIFPIFINLIVSFVLALVIVSAIVCDPTEEVTMLESNSRFGLHSFSIVFRTGLAIVPAVSYASVTRCFGPTANWILIMQMGTICLQSSLMVLIYVVENTVMYVHWKGECGEEIKTMAVEEVVSGEYVRLVMDDTDGEVGDGLDEEDEANGGFNYVLCLLTIVWVVLLCVQFYYIFAFYKKDILD